jgi:hypothetical protein
MFSRCTIVAVLLSLGLWPSLWPSPAVATEADDAGAYRISGPVVHGNLAIYHIHGTSRPGPVPLTIQEALENGTIEVREIGDVNELEVENKGDQEIFIQAGDIVKGGQQDRVLSVSTLLPPHSGTKRIVSFCVESGRWSGRGDEDARRFSSAKSALPSRLAKVELAEAAAAPKNAPGSPPVGTRQLQIWQAVSQIQGKLSSNIGAPVAAPRSRTSLQLSLENGRLQREQDEYLGALEASGQHDDDIVGYVFAVNGKVNSADIYSSNALFRKMWGKLLRASITEAIGERDGANDPAPPAAAASDFIKTMSSGQAVERKVDDQTSLRLRQSNRTMLLETRPAAAPAAAWTYRNYLAR